MTTDCASGRSINVAAEQTGGMTVHRFTQRSHWTLLYSSLVLIYSTLLCCDWTV